MTFLLTSKFLKAAAISVVLFILLDYLWLAVIASKWYRQSLGHLAELDAHGKIIFNIPMGLVAQVVLSLCLSFVVGLSLQVDHRLTVALAVGTFTGFALYAVYDFTNLSFVKNYPLWIALIDVAWGTLQGLLAGWYFYKLFNG
ncbi:MAG: DUF2177 family protein [Cyclobacteriaceae bacterium]|jgi:uncharacterized membrane protein|nr:DUF2177 family protein [Cyclobacteriaceae bacterium]